MSQGISQIHVRHHRGNMEVQAIGQTARGQKYIKAVIQLDAKGPEDPKLKAEIATAVAKLME